MTGFDIIGDVHGRADKLRSLLNQLGYREDRGTWRHADRTAIFVGDLIDRGDQQVDTVHLVRRMVDAGAARCILGNHEFNAIAWATPDPDSPGCYVRRHEKKGNREQHHAFLKEVEGKPIHLELVNWFKTLPLWLDLGPLRVVHACWSAAHIDALRPLLSPSGGLTDDLVISSSREEHWSFRAVEMLCKGPEVPLPKGIMIRDKEGKERDKARLKWWDTDRLLFKDSVLALPETLKDLSGHPLPEPSPVAPYKGAPVFFGHYSLADTPARLGRHIACVDYYNSRGNPLVAYRWGGESELENGNFVII